MLAASRGIAARSSEQSCAPVLESSRTKGKSITCSGCVIITSGHSSMKTPVSR
jgi:hypothetical protein